MAPRAFTPEEVDFDAFYQGKPPVEGSDLAFDTPPWDIGEPQPALVALVDSGAVRGEVLDAGCGLGENAIYLAKRGYRVTGVDGAETALEAARRRAADRGVDVEFTRTEVTTMRGVPDGRFDTVLDSALYHCLGEAERGSYAAALHRVTAPGARLHLFCFSDVGNEGFQLPMTVSRDDLREHLGGHWAIGDIEQTDYATAVTRETFEALGPERLRQTGMVVDPGKLRLDERGRVLGRVWHVSATRR